MSIDSILRMHGIGGVSGFKKGSLVPNTKLSAYQASEVKPLLTLAATARDMWVIDEGQGGTVPNPLRIIIFLTNDTIIEVDGNGTIVRNVSISGKYSGSITQVKMQPIKSYIGSAEVDWVFFTTYDNASTARLYAVDMTNGNVHLVYTSTAMPSIGWDYIGIYNYDGTKFYIMLTTKTSHSKTLAFPHTWLIFNKGRIGTTPTIGTTSIYTTQQMFSADTDPTYGSTVNFYPCEKGFLATMAGWSGGQYYGIRRWWGAGASATTRGGSYGGSFGNPGGWLSNYSYDGLITFQSGYVDYYYDPTGTYSLFDYNYMVDRYGTEIQRGRVALGPRDSYSSYVGDRMSVLSGTTRPNFTNGLVVNSSVKNVNFYSHVGSTIASVSDSYGNSHFNYNPILIVGNVLYKYTGAYGKFIL